MVFNDRYNQSLKTEKDLKEQFNNHIYIENNIIKDIDVIVTGHYGNIVSVDMLCENIRPFPLYNSTDNIGYIIRALIEIFDKEDDNSVSINSLKNTPIRIVYDADNKFEGHSVAIGHFMKNRFILIDDLMKVHEWWNMTNN